MSGYSDPSARLNPHAAHGRCRYCGKPLPSHMDGCRSLLAWYTGNQEATSNESSLVLAPETVRAALKAAGSSWIGRGGRVSATWSRRGSSTLASRRLTARRSNVGSRSIPSLTGTATTKTPVSLPSSQRVVATIGTEDHIVVEDCRCYKCRYQRARKQVGLA